MGEKTYVKAQYGVEVTRGTPVVATRIWPGTVSVPSDRTPKRTKFMDGTRLPAHKRTIGQIHVDGISLACDNMTFQALPILGVMALKGTATGAEVTTGQADYLWDFTPSWTATNAPKAITLEYGDDTQAYEIEYCMAKRLRFSGKMGDDSFIKCEAELFGRQITPTTFTAAQALAGTELMLANMTKIYIDTAWAGLGGTQITGLIKEWALEMTIGTHAKFMGDGSKLMTTHGEGIIDAILTMTYEGNAAADTQFDLFQAGTERAIRISVSGSQIGTGTYHNLTLDLFGGYDAVVPLGGEDNGNNLHTAIFSINSDRQATAHALAMKVTTSINAV